MSALAAMFAPPRVRHTPNRVIVSGREIKGCGDLPPLPDAESRRALKAKIKNIQKRQWDARNPEKVKATYERWIAQNRERHNATSYQYYLSVRDTPEYKAAASERMRRWREENREQANEATKRWKAANKEHLKAYRKAYKERKRNEREQEKREHEQRAKAEAAQAIELGRKSSSAAHAKRVQTTANDARSISAASV